MRPASCTMNSLFCRVSSRLTGSHSLPCCVSKTALVKSRVVIARCVVEYVQRSFNCCSSQTEKQTGGIQLMTLRWVNGSQEFPRSLLKLSSLKPVLSNGYLCQRMTRWRLTLNAICPNTAMHMSLLMLNRKNS